ncbi:MAG: hypothetical protein JWQ02_2090 [Capsulimonas sp.]|nr:hypothetical protein [Capsulimonas sp.]
MTHFSRWTAALVLLVAAGAPHAWAAPAGTVTQDSAARTVTMADAQGALRIRLNYADHCFLDRVEVDGRETVAPDTGVASGILAGGQWSTTRSGVAAPKVRVTGSVVDVDGIAFGAGGVAVREEWRFTVHADGIDWRILRKYPSGAQIEDMMLPGWDFAGMDTWTGGVLDTGGVAWGHLLGEYSTYGAHASAVTFWKPGQRDALRITTAPAGDLHVAARFTRQPSGIFSYVQSAAPQEIVPKHGLRRYLGSGADLWAPIAVQPAPVQVDMKIEALDYAQTYGRGVLPGIDEAAVSQLLNTIGRYGVIDRGIVSGNGWVTGFVCLHEPFYGALAATVADPNYTAGLAKSLDSWRDHALQPDGRLKTRWVYENGMDNMVPGSYDSQSGYYDCGWGALVDSQPDYPINVSETFDLNGDLKWLRSHKESCERALNWMLARDLDHNGLMTMMTDSHTDRKSSDWIDIVFACGKNALVNVEMYHALTLWAEREEILGDKAQAARYRAAASRLQKAFVRPVSQGGFWDQGKGCFVYWLEKDGSAHGDNLVTPVNFCAIAYGVCNADQRKTILDNIDSRMQREGLFHWPLCFTPFAPEECMGMQPFPSYENGDIFLSWGELGVRAYADYKPAIAVHYVRAILDRYKKDGLAFQRYLRNSQDGAGEDILAGNSNTIAGLYRDIYGIRPQWNRLMLDPHLTPDLAGARLHYDLRGQRYALQLDARKTTVTVDGAAVQSPGAFALRADRGQLTYYAGPADRPALRITRPPSQPIRLDIAAWPTNGDGPRRWTVTAPGKGAPLRHVVSGLAPKKVYALSIDSKAATMVTANTRGEITFGGKAGSSAYALRSISSTRG